MPIPIPSKALQARQHAAFVRGDEQGDLLYSAGHTDTWGSHSDAMKNKEEDLEQMKVKGTEREKAQPKKLMAVGEACAAISWPTHCFKGREPLQPLDSQRTAS